MEGVGVVPEESKPALLRQAAKELTTDKRQETAVQILRDLIGRLVDPTELRLTYLSLADVAKSLFDWELETASLERVLDSDPSDSRVRFRLAFLYSDKNQRLSMYHYNLRLNQGRDGTALNNLGVAYGKLSLPGREIAAFAKASEDSLLAKANLSHAYIDRGFLTEAETLATEVTRADCDEIERSRAIDALRRISTMRSTEKETVEKLLTEVKEERAFRSAYAEAFVASLQKPVNGIFVTPHGRLEFSQDGNQLHGEGRFEEEVSAGLFATFGGPATLIKVRSVKFVITIVGRSGRLKLEIEEVEKRSFPTVPKSTTVHGLVIIAENGDSFEALEEHETGAKIYKSTKETS